MTTKSGEFSERLKSIVKLRGITQDEGQIYVVEGPKKIMKNYSKQLDLVLK